jgi:XRN 5'-3' exonuclease N-terminus
MGIKGFRGWFESQFESSVTQLTSADTDRFDHVLIDMNPLLHICTRKSRNDGHGLTLLIKELDSILSQIQPTQSLVLAIDGPPSAAKLATQRKRRWQILKSTAGKLQKLEALGSKRLSTKQVTKRKRRLTSETRTLRITPGTDFMKLAEQAILYWAWQRFDSRSSASPLSQGKGVKVFLSPSEVPGEGEVKLLEWIYKKPRRGESIAILSGDSDLVLEALLIPIHSTHNVFVIWPSSSPSKGRAPPSKHYTCVGLYETTRRLQSLIPNMSFQHLMRLRTDLVLLLLLNGNDYLPKLRGSSGFNKLFGNYARMQQEQSSMGKEEPHFLVDPDTLEFNLEHCIKYFQRLATAATSYPLREEKQKPPLSVGAPHAVAKKQSNQSPLQRLRNFIDAGYIPKPLQFHAVSSTGLNKEGVNGDAGGVLVDFEDEGNEDDAEDSNAGGGGEDEDDESDVGDDDSEFDVEGKDAPNQGDEILLQLRLGEQGSEESYLYELWYPRALPRKEAKQELARMALIDILDYDDEFDELDDSKDEDGMYEWELRQPVEAKVDSYLYGLLWNLQTYQDGVCADYSWNYGKRRSPTAHEVLHFFLDAVATSRNVGLKQLQTKPFSPPIKAGVACLAALPCSEKHLVPEPYRWLADETVEEMYGVCMSKEDNAFDASEFERMCDEYLSGLPPVDRESAIPGANSDDHGRRIILSDHFWTVVSKVSAPLPHPFDPPAPFSDMLSKLRSNNRIRITKVASIQEPRPRAIWGDHVGSVIEPGGLVGRDKSELGHVDPAPFMDKLKSLEELDFKKAYPKSRVLQHAKKAPKNPSRSTTSSTRLLASRTKDGLSAMACLKQLQDGGVVGAIDWEEVALGETHEMIRLRVSKGKAMGSSVLRDDLSLEHERDVRTVSKNALKQHLAGLALCEIAGPTQKWSEYAFKDLRRCLQERR